MKKLIFASMLLMAGLVGGSVSSDAIASEENPNEFILNAYRVTGDRVIFRSGPGKGYAQIRDWEGRPIYFDKGYILLPESGGVRNGFRNVYIPDADIQSGWVSVKYLKFCKWNDGKGE